MRTEKQKSILRTPSGPSRTHQDPAGPIRTHQDPAGPSRTQQDPSGPSRTHQDPARPSRTHQDPAGPSAGPSAGPPAGPRAALQNPPQVGAAPSSAGCITVFASEEDSCHAETPPYLLTSLPPASCEEATLQHPAC